MEFAPNQTGHPPMGPTGVVVHDAKMYVTGGQGVGEDGDDDDVGLTSVWRCTIL
jgi:hypothetical protein